MNKHAYKYALAAAFVTFISAPAMAQTLRYSSSVEPPVLDPVFNALAVTAQYGHLVYDTLFSQACDGSAKPQMVEDYTVETGESGAVYTMVLREGLKFHDGADVTATDVVASINRWASLDTKGSELVQIGMKVAKVDDRTFTITMPFESAVLLDALAKPRAVGLFVMREVDALVPSSEPVTNTIGSGPFRFVESEFVKGHKMVFEKNEDYVPRAEPADCLAGGKVVNIDRVEWLAMPDHATALTALMNDELDMVEAVPQDLMPIVASDPNVELKTLDEFGRIGYARFNFSQPPFDKPEARRGLIKLINQADAMQIVAGSDPAFWSECYSYFGCNTSNEKADYNSWMSPTDVEEAKALFAEAGYNGEPIVLMATTDDESMHRMGIYLAEVMRAAGLNVDLQTMDFGTLIARDTNPAADDWNVSVAWNPAPELNDPLRSRALYNGCPGENQQAAGWYCSEEINALKAQWVEASDPAAQAEIVDKIAADAAEIMPYALLGQFLQPSAMRKEFTGFLNAEVPVFWNISEVN